MPWSRVTFDAVCAGLRQAARDGEFVPLTWNDRIETNDAGGCQFYGCGWGLVGWYAAITNSGGDWARHMLPVGCAQIHVDAVLNLCGVTGEEIDGMTPLETWQHFDTELLPAYNTRHDDWEAFIAKSTELAEFFITVLRRVPVDESMTIPHLPFLAVPPVPEATLPLFQYVDAAKPTTLVLTPEDMVQLT